MSKKIIASLLLAALAVSPATAQGITGCYMYTKDDFGGAQWTMPPNSEEQDFGNHKGWNDEISSAFVFGNCSLMLYENSRFRGAGVLVTTKMTRLKIINGGFNDKTSSAKCTCS